MSQNNSGKQHLVISAIGTDRAGIVGQLSKAILDVGCNILDSRMAVLGGEFTVMLLIEGPWNAVQKLEDQQSVLATRLELTLQMKRTHGRQPKPGRVPYSVEVVTVDHPGIVYQLAAFFSERAINIEDLASESYAAPHTGTPMFSARLIMSLPSDRHIGELREQFADFCDNLNLDAVMEPLKT